MTLILDELSPALSLQRLLYKNHLGNLGGNISRTAHGIFPLDSIKNRAQAPPKFIERYERITTQPRGRGGGLFPGASPRIKMLAMIGEVLYLIPKQA